MFKDKSIVLETVEKDIKDYISTLFVENKKPWACSLPATSFGTDGIFENMTGYSICLVSHVGLIRVYTKQFRFSANSFKELEPVCVNIEKKEITYYHTERMDDGDYLVSFALVRFVFDIDDWVKFKYYPDEVPQDQFKLLSEMYFKTQQENHLRENC